MHLSFHNGNRPDFCTVLLEVVIRNDKVIIKQHGYEVVNGRTSGKDLQVVDIKVGMDKMSPLMEAS